MVRRLLLLGLVLALAGCIKVEAPEPTVIVQTVTATPSASPEPGTTASPPQTNGAAVTFSILDGTFPYVGCGEQNSNAAFSQQFRVRVTNLGGQPLRADAYLFRALLSSGEVQSPCEQPSQEVSPLGAIVGDLVFRLEGDIDGFDSSETSDDPPLVEKISLVTKNSSNSFQETIILWAPIPCDDQECDNESHPYPADDPSIAFAGDEEADKLRATAADPGANWNRLAISVFPDDLSFNLNEPATETESVSVSRAYRDVSSSSNPVSVGDFVSFCSDSDQRYTITVTVKDIVAKSILGRFRFLQVEDCIQDGPPTFALSRDDATDRLSVTSADSDADWNRLAVKTPVSGLMMGLNTAAESGKSVGTTNTEITSFHDFMSAGEFIEFCGAQGTVAGVTFTISDTTAGQVLGTFTFNDIMACY